MKVFEGGNYTTCKAKRKSLLGKSVLAKAGKDTAPAISRGLDSWNFNWYTPAYMGFRGAMNLCSLWLEFLSED